MAQIPDRTLMDQPPGDLISGSAGGDLDSFRRLMEEHRDYSFRVAFGLLHDRDEAEDAVQEAFISAWGHFEGYRTDVKFTTWLYRIVVNASYDRIRARSRRERIFGYLNQLFGGGDPPGGDDPGAQVEAADLKEAVVRLAKRLPPKQYLVFHLRDLLDLSVEEAAANAGMSVNSVKVNLCLARKKIRTGLERMRETRR